MECLLGWSLFVPRKQSRERNPLFSFVFPGIRVVTVADPATPLQRFAGIRKPIIEKEMISIFQN